jgi:predicted nucleic acid-binding protein
VGSLSVSLSGLIYVDTQTVIYSVETQAPYWPALEELWQVAQRGSVVAVTSELTLMETLVKPIRQQDRKLIQAYDDFLHTPDVRLVPISQATLREAARLRADITSLRTPDALHAATSMLHGCTQFLTNDDGFRRVPGLPVVMLRDVLIP